MAVKKKQKPLLPFTKRRDPSEKARVHLQELEAFRMAQEVTALCDAACKATRENEREACAVAAEIVSMRFLAGSQEREAARLAALAIRKRGRPDPGVIGSDERHRRGER